MLCIFELETVLRAPVAVIENWVKCSCIAMRPTLKILPVKIKKEKNEFKWVLVA